jgi:hypothetical protein
MEELSLWLDYYDDIYSDFDSRQYHKRRISEDFLQELKRSLKENKDRLSALILLLPTDKRNFSDEAIIISSLKQFFNEQHSRWRENCHRKWQQGIALGIAGMLAMLVNAVIGLREQSVWPLTLLRILLEPGAWFLLWASLDFLFYDWKEMKKERDFFRRLTELSIHFKSS